MDLYLIGLTLTTLGEVLLAMMILVVHYKIKQEKKIDKYVIREITHEEFLGVISICLIIVGYLLQVMANQTI